MKKKTIFLIVIFVCLLTNGCDKIKRKNVICLVDYSGTIKPETLEIYANTFASDIFMNLGVSDKLVLIPIDEGSKIKAVQLLYYDLSKESFDKNVTTVTHRQDEINKHLNEFKMQKKDLVYNTLISEKEKRKEFTNLTDILSAMEQVPLNMEHTEKTSMLTELWGWLSGETETETENVIIVFSDMVQESGELNFLKTNLDDKNINKLITDLKSKNRIPNFADSKIFICGRTGKNNSMIDNIHSFWKKYFEESKADLRIYDYDSSKAIADYLHPK
jgi:hypothetical protein